jgi:hypothetical protein
MNIIATDNGRIRDASDVLLADKVLESKNDIWATIDLLVNAWEKKSPEDFKAFKVQMGDYRSGLFDRRFAQTKDGKNHERRFTMVFPEKLYNMIRAIYKADELPMDKKFYYDFLKRYPFFRVPEKI